MSLKFLRLAKVLDITGLSKSYTYQLLKTGFFPQPVKITPNGTARAWVKTEIIEWMEGRVLERDMEVE